ncbi:MAG: MFS transporter, partial [Granulosicoccus sp.]|nr:MFS transporter [Granulosicoccus sp.]
LLYRVGQGMFGAPIVPVSQAIVLRTFTGDKRAAAQAFFGMAVVAGMGLAPVVGGLVAEHYNWRAVFLMLIPVCAAALVMTLLFIREGGRNDSARLDWTGFLTLSLAIACLQLLLDRGENLGWFDSGEILLYCAGLALGLYLFIVQTATAEQPFLNRELLRNRNYVIGLFLVCFYGMLNFTPITLLPPLLQNLQGYPDSLVGWLLAMRGLGMIVGFYVASRLGRVDPRYSMATGFLMIAMSGFALATIESNSRADWIAWAGLLQGIGSGILWVPVTTAAFWSLPERLLPDGAAIFHLLRNLGQSVYIAASFMVVVRTTQVSSADLAPHINAFNERLGFPWVTGLWNLDTPGAIKALSSEMSRQSQLIGFNNAFVFYSWTCIAVIPIVLLWRKQPAEN